MIKTAAQIMAALDGQKAGDAPRKMGRPRTIDYQGDVCLDEGPDCDEGSRVYGLGRCPFHYRMELKRRKASGELVKIVRCTSLHPSGEQCTRNTHKTLTRDNGKNQDVKSPHRAGELKWM